MMFRLIEAEKTQHPVSLLCGVLGVTRAGYYAWRRRGPSRRALGDVELASLIRRVFVESLREHKDDSTDVVIHVGDLPNNYETEIYLQMRLGAGLSPMRPRQ